MRERERASNKREDEREKESDMKERMREIYNSLVTIDRIVIVILDLLI